MKKKELFHLRNNSSLTISGSNKLLSTFKYKLASKNSHSDEMKLARIDKYLQAIWCKIGKCWIWSFYQLSEL